MTTAAEGRVTTGGTFIEDVRRKAMQIVVDGETYRVQPSEVAYDLEIIAEPEDTVLGYIARLNAESDGFVAVGDVDRAVPEGHVMLEDGIRSLVR
ncbi:hypothetical protein ACEXQD_07050 [Herbiconiux sp. P15]|uniref:hypothetical protein n=1 Tax=Herbiconiux liukaitaii TaxID=3342799 RepID=UPI0035BA77E0